MPRTTKVECPGCPPIRSLTFDVLGLVKGKLLGCFVGKCSGSIRSVARHPELPVLASCARKKVFLKQHLSTVLLDSNFNDEELASTVEDLPSNKAHDEDDTLDEDVEEMPVKRKKSSKERNPTKKLKPKKRSKKLEGRQ